MKNKASNNTNPDQLISTLWTVLAGSRPKSAPMTIRQLATPGGRRKFLRLRMNEVLDRTQELSTELSTTKSEERKSRLQALIDHQAQRADKFVQRFERMLSSAVHA